MHCLRLRCSRTHRLHRQPFVPCHMYSHSCIHTHAFPCTGSRSYPATCIHTHAFTLMYSHSCVPPPGCVCMYARMRLHACTCVDVHRLHRRPLAPWGACAWVRDASQSGTIGSRCHGGPRSRPRMCMGCMCMGCMCMGSRCIQAWDRAETMRRLLTD